MTFKKILPNRTAKTCNIPGGADIRNDTSQRSFQVFGLGQCYIPGITHFTSVDTFIQQTFLLLNVHFSGVNYSRFTHVLFYAGIALTWTSRFSPRYVEIDAYISWRA